MGECIMKAARRLARILIFFLFTGCIKNTTACFSLHKSLAYTGNCPTGSRKVRLILLLIAKAKLATKMLFLLLLLLVVVVILLLLLLHQHHNPETKTKKKKKKLNPGLPPCMHRVTPQIRSLQFRSHSSHAFFFSFAPFRFYLYCFEKCHVCRRSA